MAQTKKNTIENVIDVNTNKPTLGFMNVSELAFLEHYERNRSVNEKHANKIMSSIRKKGIYGTIGVIQYNKATGRILDGQNRLAAMRKLVEKGELSQDTEIPVAIYDFIEDVETVQIKDINQNQQKWGNFNYLEVAAVDSPDFSRFKDFVENTSNFSKYFDGKTETINIRIAYSLAFGKGGQKILSLLKKGAVEEFYFDEEVKAKLLKRLEFCCKVINNLGYSFSSCAEAFGKVWPEYEQKNIPEEVWLKHFSLKAKSLTKRKPTRKEEWQEVFDAVLSSIVLNEKELFAFAA